MKLVESLLLGGIAAAFLQGAAAGEGMPEIAADRRFAQAPGAAPSQGAAQQNKAPGISRDAPAAPSDVPPSSKSYAFPAARGSSYGFAVQGGAQLNVDYLSPSDKLWLQAAYEKGAFGYVAGNHLGFAEDPAKADGSAGHEAAAIDGWDPQIQADCVVAGALNGNAPGGGACEPQAGGDAAAGLKDYRLPTLSSASYGSYLQMNYPANALKGFGGAAGVSNLKETRVGGANLAWTPFKGLDIGAEFMYVHVTDTRPVGVAANAQGNSNSVGLRPASAQERQ
jgi:hypothetical protein